MRGYDIRQRRRRFARLLRYGAWAAFWTGALFTLFLSNSADGAALGPVALGVLVMALGHGVAWLFDRAAEADRA